MIFPINANLLLLLQVVRISCSSLVGEWIGSFHHCPDWIHTVHTLLSYRLDPEDPSDDPSDPYHPYPTSYPTYVWHIARRVGTSKSSSISGCIRWIFCTPARPLLFEAGFAGGHVPTEGTREAADAQLKICCFFPDGLWLSG